MLNITKVLLYLKEAGVFPSDEGGEVKDLKLLGILFTKRGAYGILW